MKVLVTGGAGFIGSHIVDKLLYSGSKAVVVLDNLSTGALDNVNPKARFIHKDIRDRDLTELFAREKFDYVIHQAAQTTVPKSIADPRYDCEVNVLGLVNILEACRQTGVKRIVFASSAAVYGDVETLPIAETADKRPASFYGLSKLTEEHYLNMYFKKFGLEYVVLRYANVFGERQSDSGEGGVISIFFRQLLANRPVTVFGDGEQTRDFVYVRDVAEANVKAIAAVNANQCYNISTGTETTINALITLMSQVAESGLAVKYAPERDGDIKRSALDNSQAARGLGWIPSYTLYGGLVETYRWLQQKALTFRESPCEASA